MKKNMGYADRIIRVIIAAILVSLFSLQLVPVTAGLVFLIIGVVLLLTALAGYCPFYALFRLDTNDKQHTQNRPHL
jgi:hypothetical protein